MSSAPKQQIDVVIPTFERWDLTKRCLARLLAQTASHTVIVVDNGSKDGTPHLVRAKFPSVEVIELEQNLGFTVACNRGVASGSGGIIVLLNNDVEAEPDFLERLVRPFADPQLGSAAPLLARPGGETIDCVGLCADVTLATFPRLRNRPRREAPSSRPVLLGPSGGGGAYRRVAWEQAGGLDEGVSFYGEDADLAFRLRAAGWRTAAVTDAVAIHLGSATAGRRSHWQRYQGGFSRGYFLRRYRTLTGPAMFRALVTEAIVALGDAAMSRDLSATRGRLAGWRAARSMTPRPMPPAAALDRSIGFLQSLEMRRAVYSD